MCTYIILLILTKNYIFIFLFIIYLPTCNSNKIMHNSFWNSHFESFKFNQINSVRCDVVTTSHISMATPSLCNAMYCVHFIHKRTDVQINLPTWCAQHSIETESAISFRVSLERVLRAEELLTGGVDGWRHHLQYVHYIKFVATESI